MLLDNQIRFPYLACCAENCQRLRAEPHFWAARAIVRAAVVMLLDRWQWYGRAGHAIRTAPRSAASATTAPNLAEALPSRCPALRQPKPVPAALTLPFLDS